MSAFFRAGEVQDPLYELVRDPPNHIVQRGRTFIEKMWDCCATFLDPSAHERAATDLMPVWWELYLAYALVSVGKKLIKRQSREPKLEGPDLLVSPNIWIEAVAPTNGQGENAIPPTQPGVAYAVPNEKLILRLRTAIEAKIKKFEAYRKRGWVRDIDSAVIAVSAGRLDFRYQDYVIPRVVQALYGAGHLTITLDRQTAAAIDQYANFRDTLPNARGASVRTDLFLTPEHRTISAVLYSTADCVNFPRDPATDFILVHNPLADRPLPRKWLPVGSEYWMEEGDIRGIRHS
jgi:hypothetical protein